MTATPGAQAAGDAVVFGVESPVYAAIRAAQFVAMLAVVGALTFRFGAWPAARRRTPILAALDVDLLRRLDRVAFGGMLASGVVTLVRFAAQHAAMFGTGESWTRTTVEALLMQSVWGRGWWLGIAGVVAGSWGARHMDGRLGRTTLVAATGALAASLAMSGHPAAAPSPSMAIVIDALHVFGAGAWVGGLACLAGVAIPLVVQRADGDGHRLLATLVSSFSPVALGGAALAAVTGGVAAWRNLGSPDALLTSDYGRWLLAKTGAIAVAAALGAYNWKRVGPSLGEASATLKLRRAATLELSAMLVVVLITAALVASPFPGEVEGTTTP